MPNTCAHTGQPLKPLKQLGPDFAISEEGVVYSLKAKSVDYGTDYFLDEYRAQYGRTYLEDEAFLRKLARQRLASIQARLPPPARLFEIGCACGFFLDEAHNLGYSVAGIEISSFASAYARDELGLNVEQAAFPAAVEAQAIGGFDIVAAFYVMEHAPDQGHALRSIAGLLRPGGLFAFALPSTHGPLYQYSPATWASTHPTDHFADYSPRSLSRILPLYDMDLVCAEPASFHPERLGARHPLRWLKPVYRWYARRNAYGDTMNGIAQKRSSHTIHPEHSPKN